MKLKAVLFDLDGTLLPMNQDEFIGAYFKELAKVACNETVTPETLKNMIWASTKAMVTNARPAKHAAYGNSTVIPTPSISISKPESMGVTICAAIDAV